VTGPGCSSSAIVAVPFVKPTAPFPSITIAKLSGAILSFNSTLIANSAALIGPTFTFITP
jgi:hypothetical protein